MATEKKLTGYPSIDKPWLKYYSEDAITGELPGGTIFEYFSETNSAFPDDTAILYQNLKITYREVFLRVSEAEQAFLALGVLPGEIVTMAMPNIPEMIYALYALNKIGAVVNLVHPLPGANELKAYLLESNSRIFLLFDGTYEIAKTILSETSVEQIIAVSPVNSLPVLIRKLYHTRNPRPMFAPNVTDWPDFIKHGARESVSQSGHKGGKDDFAIMVHTGGTTGTPKGVMLSNYAVNSIIWQIGNIYEVNRADKMLTVLPPFVGYGLINGVLEPLALGITAVFIPDYKADQQDKYFRKYKPQHLNSIPAYWDAMLKNPRLKGKDLSFLKILVSGGDAMSPQTENEINQFLEDHHCKYRLIKGLGCTEMGSCAALSFDAYNLVGSVGIPLPRGECKIVSTDTGEELPYNQEGEICFGGPNLMQGYYQNPEETNDMIKIHSDGKRWLHTGDLGYLTEDGALFISGRIKRIMITAGEDGNPTKLFPARVEKAIRQHSAVELCCVVGVEDPRRINAPVAFVVLHPEQNDLGQVKAEILKMCASALPAYMVPSKIIPIDSFPRTKIGKVDYLELEKIANQS